MLKKTDHLRQAIHAVGRRVGVGHPFTADEVMTEILRIKRSAAVAILRAYRSDVDSFEDKIIMEIMQIEEADGFPMLFKTLCKFATHAAKMMKHQYLGTEHILIAITADGNSTKCGRALAHHGFDYSAAMHGVLSLLYPRG